MSGEMLFGDAAFDPEDLQPFAELGELRCALGEPVGKEDVCDCFR